MSVLQTVNLSADTVKMRWKEPYVTAGLNQKNLSNTPKGVVLGFNVAADNATMVISVNVDPATLLSLANIRESTGNYYALTLVSTSNANIDLTAQANQTVFIVLDAQYAIGANSAAQIKVVDALELAANLDLVVLAKVNVPAAAPLLDAHINHGYRTLAGDNVLDSTKTPVNLIQNGTFERDTAPSAPQQWTSSGGGLTLTTDNAVAKTGTKSMKLTSAGVVSLYAMSGPMTVQEGKSYRVGAWMRSTGGAPITGVGAKLQVEWFNAAGGSLSVTDIETAFTGGSTTFVEKKNRVAAPANSSSAKVRVFYDNCSGQLWVDDIEFTTRDAEALGQSAVFGGPASVADAFHTHTAGGAYGGSPNWADGTSIPAGSIESGIDAVPTAIGGASGAAKMGFTPVTPIDLTATRVDNALNELDDKKAGLAQPNVFTKPQTVTPSVAGVGLTASGNGANYGVRGNGGTPTQPGVAGFGGTPDGMGVGGQGVGAGQGVRGDGGASDGPGVEGHGGGQGRGVFGVGGASTSATEPGQGVYGVGGENSVGAGGTGGYFIGGDHTGDIDSPGVGVIGVGGAVGNGGRSGVQGYGSGSANGVEGYAGGGGGNGVVGQGGSNVNDAGVSGYGPSFGVRGDGDSGGVYGTSNVSYGGRFEGPTGVLAASTTSGPGVQANGAGNNVGVLATGAGSGAGVQATDGGAVAGVGTVWALRATATNGTNAGGIKATAGPTGQGIAGWFQSGGVANGLVSYGGQSVTGSEPSQAGVFGRGEQYGLYGNSGVGWGVYGVGATGGVYGETTANNAGVWGKSAIAATPALMAQNTNGTIDTRIGLESRGVIKIANNNPGSSVAFTNTLTQKNIVKAYGRITTAFTVASISSDSFNISAVTWNAGGLRWDVTLASPIGGFGAWLVSGDNSAWIWFRNPIGVFSISASTSIGGANQDFGSIGSSAFNLIVIGAH